MQASTRNGTNNNMMRMRVAYFRCVFVLHIAQEKAKFVPRARLWTVQIIRTHSLTLGVRHGVAGSLADKIDPALLNEGPLTSSTFRTGNVSLDIELRGLKEGGSDVIVTEN